MKDNVGDDVRKERFSILVLGGGGREHALCWKIADSALLETLYCAPGNGGINQLATQVDLDAANAPEIIAFCHDKDIKLVVIGPEAPLVDGLADALDEAGIAAFGPGRYAAQLEGSKGFTKDICTEYNIPTAAYGRFDNAADAHAYLDNHPAPIVVKADGLAAGKGVIIAETDSQAHDAVDMIFAGSFGTAGAELVIEEFMTGEEASFFVLCDGKMALPLATAQDHKRVGDNDTGPNTGGMGAYSPAPVMTDALVAQTMEKIINPTLQAMTDRGHPFKGVLYAGLMLTDEGPKLVEYNVRFGDPECQVLMARLESDIVPALLASAQGDLSGITLDWSDETALTVVMASQGYPGDYTKGTQINGVENATATGVTVFHAGTEMADGKLLATGGRVLNVTGTGADVAQAKAQAYQGISAIDWSAGFCRTDIGWRAINKIT